MKKEDWMQAKWRPAMGWMYMSVCIFDFMLAPVLWSVLQSLTQGNVSAQWQPLTLQGAGLFHLAMGAVLGIAAFGRTQEKLSGTNNGGLSTTSNFGSTFMPSTTAGQQAAGDFNTSGFPPQPSGNFNGPGNSSTRFSAGMNQFNTGFNGKRSPMPTDDPEL